MWYVLLYLGIFPSNTQRDLSPEDNISKRFKSLPEFFVRCLFRPRFTRLDWSRRHMICSILCLATQSNRKMVGIFSTEHICSLHIYGYCLLVLFEMCLVARFRITDHQWCLSTMNIIIWTENAIQKHFLSICIYLSIASFLYKMYFIPRIS